MEWLSTDLSHGFSRSRPRAVPISGQVPLYRLAILAAAIAVLAGPAE